MSDIKQIDLSFFDEKPTLLDRFVNFTGFTFLYSIQSFYDTYLERISRSLAFAKIGWLNYDFDSQFLYKLMSFKLKRVLYVLETYGHHLGEEENIKALKEAIEICDRLFSENYDEKYLNKHDEKWGLLKTKSGKEYKNSVEVIFTRDKANTEEEKALETKEFGECVQKGIEDRSKDIYRLAHLLDKHQTSWWD